MSKIPSLGLRFSENRKNRRSRLNKAAWSLAVFCVILLALNFAAGFWLRRGADRDDCGTPQVLYLVAGAKAQDRRIEALLPLLRHQDAGGSNLSATLGEIWIGNDFETGPWSAAEGRNLSRAEWAAVKLREGLGPQAGSWNIRIVPGRAWSTAGEMAALAAEIDRRQNDLRSRGAPLLDALTLVTCPTHVRRTRAALRRHGAGGLKITAVAAADSFYEWMPTRNLGEVLKIVRDAAGLGAAPLISRSWYQADRPGRSNGAVASSAGVIMISALLAVTYAWMLYPWLLKRIVVRTADRLPGACPNSAGPVPAPAGAAPEKNALARTAFLIAAHNEEAVIEERLINICRQHFPLDSLTVYVGVDGATDKTESAAAAGAQRAAQQGLKVRMHADSRRRGKIAMLKKLVAIVEREEPETAWLVFSDANTQFAPEALKLLLQPFCDPSVGGVCGRLILTPGEESGRNADGGQAAEGAYWRWENSLKTMESRLDSCLGANGAIYAIRRALFPDDLPDNTIVDDFVIGMKIRQQGFRMIYEPAATACEPLPRTRHEWRRRVRIGAGDFQALSLCRGCLAPRYKSFAWMFASHKVLRWLTPHLLLAAWCGALIGARPAWSGGGGLLPAASLGLAAGLPALAATARGIRLLGGRTVLGRWARSCDHFLTMQAALLAGSLRWLAGNLRGEWERTPRD